MTKTNNNKRVHSSLTGYSIDVSTHTHTHTYIHTHTKATH